MKKFIVFIITAIILAVSAISCNGKVEKDIKTIVGNDVKVCSVKSIDINENFVFYTEEYNRCAEKQSYWGESKVGWLKVKVKYEDLFKRYPSSKEDAEIVKNYEEAVNSYQESVDSLGYYLGKVMYWDSLGDESTGKLYVAKLLGKNEYTHKPNEYNHYAVFAYNEDGSLHQVNTGENMRIIISTYPKAKKDLQKAIGDALPSLIDSFNNKNI